ncbi:metal-dependent hydrolase [uncultured Abyssibacter sp.]|uniref:metal-dependent hydrolase n=1 Tax=uncultured Abyssibacter sp. TaxID=2320202 RepID=UPI0032B1DD1A
MLPTRRDFRFNLGSRDVLNWHEQGPYVSHFFNTLSVFFPVGERFFMHAVRHYRDQVTDPELQKAVTAFIGQEAMHGREHEAYNAAVAKAGMPVDAMEARVHWLLEELKLHMPKSMQLSATIALEHFTAIMADKLLADERVMGDSDEIMAKIWNWHALEETEHKAVAFDVWDVAMKGRPDAYVNRAVGLIVATLIFWPLVAEFHWRMVRADPSLKKGLRARLKGYAGLANYLFRSPGALAKTVPEWFDYFRPSFQPWDHDNHEFLARIPQFEADMERLASGPKAA